jgi:Holliday junction DNA helicase RuvA
LSELSAAEIAEAVALCDDSRFRSVTGIGQKTASLIIVSLTGKMPHAQNSDVAELADALAGMGWSAAVARDVARDVVNANSGSTLADRLRIALASLGGKS